MKVLFVNHNISLWVNVGLTYVMSSVAHQHSVHLVDIMKCRKHFSDYVLKELMRYEPDVVAFSVNSYTVRDARLLVRTIKSKYPSSKVFFGGVHPTIMPEETISLPEVDAICVGEGEHPFLEYVDCLENNEEPYGVQSIWFKNTAGTIIRNSLRQFVEDLDTLPLPDWDFWDISSYMNDGEIVPGTLRVLTTRGCPYDCSFCSNPIWQKSLPGKYYRKRKPLNIIEEIERDIHKYGSKGFRFLMISDSIFGLDKSHAYEFCQLYKERGLAKRLPWGAQIRCGTMNEEFAYRLKESGCTRITLSIESGNDYMRNEVYKKELTKEQIEQTVRLLQKAGILVRAFVMIGGPGETPRMFDETLAFIKRLGLSISDLIIIRYVPLPKTELASHIDAKNMVRHSSPFSYKYVTKVRSNMNYYYFWKVRCLKVYSFVKEGLSLRGAYFFIDVITVLFKKGKSRFIPFIYLCSEQRIINWTIVQYKIKRAALQYSR